MKGLNGQKVYLNINEGLVSIYLLPTIAFTIHNPFPFLPFSIPACPSQSHSMYSQLQILSTYHIE